MRIIVLDFWHTAHITLLMRFVVQLQRLFITLSFWWTLWKIKVLLITEWTFPCGGLSCLLTMELIVYVEHWAADDYRLMVAQQGKTSVFLVLWERDGLEWLVEHKLTPSSPCFFLPKRYSVCVIVRGGLALASWLMSLYALFTIPVHMLSCSQPEVH